MKSLVLLIAAVFAFSCNSKTGDSASENRETASQGQAAQNTELIAHPMIDNKGKVMGQMTFPANWKVHNEAGKAAFSGPDGIFVFNLPLKNFMYSNDPMTVQLYRQNGGNVRAPLSAEAIVHQDLVPIAKNEGSKLIGISPAPEIAKRDGSIQDLMYTIGPRNSRFDAVVSEWQDKDGNPYAIVVHMSTMDMGSMVMWNYYGHALDAPKEQYSHAKQTLVAGLASLQYNPRYFDQYNANEMSRESASWAAHNQKMRASQQQFDAQQQAFKQKSEAINSSIMASYNARNASSDRSHNRFLNYIKDENTVVNPQDGKRYQVETGSDQYWMNNQGQYIGTNDPNYDPNRNQGTQNHNWSQAPVTD